MWYVYAYTYSIDERIECVYFWACDDDDARRRMSLMFINATLCGRVKAEGQVTPHTALPKTAEIPSFMTPEDPFDPDTTNTPGGAA